jgi:glycine/D-amino acid oxidase-like deaminating enzyme
MDADLVVVGAGAGSQASGRAAGLFKSVQADSLRTDLARRSIARAISFADWAGVDLDVRQSGSFLIARTDEHREYLRAEARQSGGWGVDVRPAGPADLHDRLPYFRAGGAELALWCPEDIYIEEPAALIGAYVAACARRGVQLLENEAVGAITLTAGRVTGVETTRRTIRAQAVVDAAGAWTRQVAELAGTSAAVAPVRHQLLITEPSAEVDRAAPIASVVDAAVYLRPARGGLMLGGFEADPLPVDPRRGPASFTTDDVPLDLSVPRR